VPSEIFTKDIAKTKTQKPHLAKIKEVFPLVKKDDYTHLTDAWWDMAFIHGKDYLQTIRAKQLNIMAKLLKFINCTNDTTNTATVL
jgi:hypothetical protein